MLSLSSVTICQL